MTSAYRAVGRLGERVVLGIDDAFDGRLDTSIFRSLGVFDRHISSAAIRVTHEAATNRPAIMQHLLQRVEHEAPLRGDDPPREGRR